MNIPRGNRKQSNWTHWFEDCRYKSQASKTPLLFILHVWPSEILFQPSWFNKCEWLEYCITANAAFCFMCRLYGKPKQARDQKNTLTTIGYIHWKRALEYYREHEKSNMHKASVICWKRFKGTQVHRDCTEQLKAANISHIVDHREYLTHIAAVTALLGKQGFAFPGHNEAQDINNVGNWMDYWIVKRWNALRGNFSEPHLVFKCTVFWCKSTQAWSYTKDRHARFSLNVFI